MFKWTDVAINTLRTGIAGGQSAGAISATLGITRNSVIGKARRIGLNFKSRPSAPAIIPAHKRNIRKPAKLQPRQQPRLVFMPAPILRAPAFQTLPIPDRAARPQHNPKRVLFLDLPFYGSCKFPLFDAETPSSERFYCGLPTEPLLSPWCSHCRAVVYSPKKLVKAA